MHERAVYLKTSVTLKPMYAVAYTKKWKSNRPVCHLGAWAAEGVEVEVLWALQIEHYVPLQVVPLMISLRLLPASATGGLRTRRPTL